MSLTAEQNFNICYREIKLNDLYMLPRQGFTVINPVTGKSKYIDIPSNKYFDDYFIPMEERTMSHGVVYYGEFYKRSHIKICIPSYQLETRDTTEIIIRYCTLGLCYLIKNIFVKP